VPNRDYTGLQTSGIVKQKLGGEEEEEKKKKTKEAGERVLL